MSHRLYTEGLLGRLRKIQKDHPGITLADARDHLRPTVSKADVDLLFDNWLNANFKPRSATSAEDRRKIAEQRARMASTAVARVEEKMKAAFMATLWDTVLPNGVIMRDATAADLKAAGAWYADAAKLVKGKQKLYGNVSPDVLFNLAKRHGHGKA
jgi:hypothetical protein